MRDDALVRMDLFNEDSLAGDFVPCFMSALDLDLANSFTAGERGGGLLLKISTLDLDLPLASRVKPLGVSLCLTGELCFLVLSGLLPTTTILGRLSPVELEDLPSSPMGGCGAEAFFVGALGGRAVVKDLRLVSLLPVGLRSGEGAVVFLLLELGDFASVGCHLSLLVVLVSAARLPLVLADLAERGEVTGVTIVSGGKGDPERGSTETPKEWRETGEVGSKTEASDAKSGSTGEPPVATMPPSLCPTLANKESTFKSI